MTIDDALKILKNATIPNNPEGKVYSEMLEIIKTQTDNFSNSSGISATKYDMETVLKNRGISVSEYEEIFGSIKRSEKDCLLYLADKLKANTSNDKDKLKTKLKLKLKLAKAKLELLKL